MFPLMTGQSGQQQSHEKKSDGFSELYLLCVVHSNCFIVFLRSGFGQEALGMRGFLALLLLLFCVGGDPRMMWWVVAYLIAIIVHRINTLRAAHRGELVHSLYAGKPLLAKLPIARSERDAMFLEMLLCFVAGALFLGVSRFIGGFMMLGFVSLAIRLAIEESVCKRRLMRIQDAQIEARFYGNSLRR